MSLKAVELQFALHKNEEVGVKQQQLTQKPLSDQASLSEAAAKQVVEERHKSTKTEESARASVKDNGERYSKRGTSGTPKRTAEAKEPEKAPISRHDHPFKGHHIDLSL
ncbi:hypothetical protein [Paenibacillus sp. EPM92]|uniref:hypothetical protein n=1 Tax=Paenibacillus sp. EPM92 TaxID=1561195 RepID=UPI0019153849|nr:hypothetical protein [Paenibacillus sp. EPM92]